MDEPTPFFEENIDRTPTGASYVVAIIIGLYLGGASFGLWRLGGYMRQVYRHLPTPSFSLSKTPDPSALQDSVRKLTDQKIQETQQTVQQQAQDQLQKQVDQQKQSLENQAKDALNTQINQ